MAGGDAGPAVADHRFTAANRRRKFRPQFSDRFEGSVGRQIAGKWRTHGAGDMAGYWINRLHFSTKTWSITRIEQQLATAIDGIGNK